MLLLQAVNLKKSYGDKHLFTITDLSIYSGDKIGIVGANGSGKSTLFDILVGLQDADSGSLKRFCELSYCRQLNRDEQPAKFPPSGAHGTAGTAEAAETSSASGTAFTSAAAWNHLTERLSSDLSGGEETRRRISETLAADAPLVLLDEPTANLDLESTRLLTKDIRRLATFLLISHDRDLLNTVCNRIACLSDGSLKVYEGNYDKYEELKEAERKRQNEEFESYEEEKDRLNRVYSQKMQAAKKVSKLPAGMTARQAGLRNFTCSSRSFDGREKRAYQSAKAVQKRIEQMDVREKPREERRMYLDFSLTDPPENKIILEGSHITCSYPGCPLLKDASFVLPNRKKAALSGPNGSGKTTLLNLLYSSWQAEREWPDNKTEFGRFPVSGLSVGSDTTFRFVPKAKPAYFYQRFDNIDFKSTLLDNALADTIQSPQAVRSILAKLLFRPEDLKKQAGVLSGGELIKLSIAKLFVSGYNLLLLDEPTNYLDMPSVIALQKMIQEYEGTILYVSHDSRFVRETADYLIHIENNSISCFDGNTAAYEEYSSAHGIRANLSNKTPAASFRKTGKAAKAAAKAETGIRDANRLLLEISLAKVVNQLGSKNCDKDTLEKEYARITEELRKL